jgi:hypothetical protein
MTGASRRGIRPSTRPFLPALRRVFTSGRKAAFPATGGSLCSRDPAATRLLRRVAVEHSGASKDTTARSRQRTSLIPLSHPLLPVPRLCCIRPAGVAYSRDRGPPPLQDLHGAVAPSCRNGSSPGVPDELLRPGLHPFDQDAPPPGPRHADHPAGHPPLSPQGTPCQQISGPFRQRFLGRYHGSDFGKVSSSFTLR